MTAKTARLVADGVGGFAGEAKCYRLTPPLDGHDHVTVFTSDLYGNRETVVVPAMADGTALNMSRMPGSISGFTQHEYALFIAGYALGEPDLAKQEEGTDGA